MAKSNQRNRAIILRRKGESIKDIAKKLKVSKSSASIWCRDVQLTTVQINNLHKKMIAGGYVGRLKGSKIQHEKRLEREKISSVRGLLDVGKLSDRDLLMLLIALYWGEGGKSQRVFFISNSDPEMIKFIINAYEKVLKIDKSNIVLSVGLNIIHKNREEEVRNYWSSMLGISLKQFRKTIFIKSKNLKKCKNFKSHYGTLRINVVKSTGYYYKMIGLINALKRAI
jgi:hypothetical protein